MAAVHVHIPTRMRDDIAQFPDLVGAIDASSTSDDHAVTVDVEATTASLSN